MKVPTITAKDLIWIIIIVAILCLKNCNGDDHKVITTPEVKGTLHDTIKVTYTKIVPKEKIVLKNVPYEVVKEVPIMGRTIYIEPIDTLKTQAFTKTIEDDKVKLTMSGIVTGKINDITADYVIKAMKVEVPRQKRFGIGISIGVDVYGRPYGGAGLNYNLIQF